MNSVPVASHQRYSRGATCPICGGADSDRRGGGTRCHGFLGDDGEYAHCSREEYAGGAPFNPESATYAHRLNGACKCGVEHGPAKPRAANWRDEPRRIAAEYDYLDEAGKLLFQAIRYEDKSFRQRRKGSDETWIWNLKDTRRVPYRLPELIEADPSQPVLVVEGEKDVDNLRALGLVATCNPMGAKKWRDEYSPLLTGRAVWIVPDNDKDGAAHVEQVAKSVGKVARSIKVLDLAGTCRTLGLGELKEKGDASDFLKMGGTAEQLVAAFEATPEYKAPRMARAKQPIEDAPSEPSPRDEDQPAEGPLGRFNRTDMGNAQRLVHLFGDRIRFHVQWKAWLIFDGRRWKEDQTGRIVRLAKKTVRLIYREAAAETDETRREALAKWAVTSESRSRIDSMIALAQSEPGIPVLRDELDSDPFLFNVRNGTIDLRTGELRQHRREDLVTKLAPVDYDPEAKAPLWDGFLEKILGTRPETIGFLRRAAGYAMTADVSEQCLFFLYGEGSNGKSTFLATIERTFGKGEYAITIDPKILTSKDHDEHPTELCDLDGPRFVNTVEVDDGKKMAKGLVKRLTGGTDAIRARRMRRDPYQFDPKFKLFLAANHKPVIRGTDHGIWRRIMMVPFEYTIRDDEKDKDFDKKLLAEKAGILAWCVRGCLEWQLGGLKPPKSVMDATSDYRKDMDSIQKFLDQRCELGPDKECKYPALYGAYKQWCDEYGIAHPLGGRKFSEVLTSKGFGKRESNGNTFYVGLELALRVTPQTNDFLGTPSGSYRRGYSA
jgi:putative DNA primase/helicase